MKPSNESQPRYGIRKFTVGVASVVIGSVLFLTPTVQATESLSHAPTVPVQVKDRSAGMEKEKPIQKKEDKVIPQGVQLADTPQPQKDLTKKKTAKEADDKHSVAVDLLRALIDEGEKKLRTLAKDHLSYQALEEALNRAKRVIGAHPEDLAQVEKATQDLRTLLNQVKKFSTPPWGKCDYLAGSDETSD